MQNTYQEVQSLCPEKSKQILVPTSKPPAYRKKMRELIKAELTETALTASKFSSSIGNYPLISPAGISNVIPFQNCPPPPSLESMMQSSRNSGSNRFKIQEIEAYGFIN